MTIEYRTITIVDSRTCRRCGSRYGFCPHTEGQREDTTLDVPRKGVTEKSPQNLRWPPERIERLIQLYEAGHTPSEIADLFCTTRGAVSGQLARCGIYGRAA